VEGGGGEKKKKKRRRIPHLASDVEGIKRDSHPSRGLFLRSSTPLYLLLSRACPSATLPAAITHVFSAALAFYGSATHAARRAANAYRRRYGK